MKISRYDTRWYLTPVQTQRLLLLVMQKSMRSCKLVMGGIYTVSLENFTTVIRAANTMINSVSTLS